jgi:hypothetical protein
MLGNYPLTLLFLLLLAFAFTGTGLLVLKTVQVAPDSMGERLFLAYALGAGVAGYAVFALAAGQFLYPAPLYLIIALLFALACTGWRGVEVTAALRVWRPPRGWIERGALALLLLFLGAAFLLALTPEIGKDALLYHLAVPKLYLRHHGFYFIPGNAFANYPFHTEMLFLLALFLQGEILAKLLAFAVVPVILLGIRQFAMHRMEQNAYPYLSMLLFFLIPSVFQLAHMAYIDLYIALYAMGAVITFCNWYRERLAGWLILCAVFTGLALACKYSTLLFPSLGVLGVAWSHRKSEESGPVLRDLALFLGVAFLVGCPFYLKNWVLTGNPLYPFMYGIFGGKGWNPELGRLYDGLFMYLGMGRGWLDYLLLPWNVSVHARMDSVYFDGFIGPLFLIVLPFLAGIRNIEPSVRITLLFCALNFLFWATSSQNIRYLSPLFPFLALTTGMVLTAYRPQKGVAILLGLVTAGCLAFNGFQIARDFMRIRPLGVISGGESRDEFLSRSLSVYPIYRFANENLPADARIFLVYAKNWTFLLERECYADSMFEHYTLKKILAASATPAEVYKRLKEKGFTHIMYDPSYVTGVKSMLSPEEIALFAAFRDKFLILLKRDRYYSLWRLEARET